MANYSVVLLEQRHNEQLLVKGIVLILHAFVLFELVTYYQKLPKLQQLSLDVFFQNPKAWECLSKVFDEFPINHF